MKNKTKFFPESEACMVNAYGNKLTEPSKGLEVTLHYREGENDPCCAEIFDKESGGNRVYAEIGLSFDGKELSDYDGAFSLPREIAAFLREEGYTVPADMI